MSTKLVVVRMDIYQVDPDKKDIIPHKAYMFDDFLPDDQCTIMEEIKSQATEYIEFCKEECTHYLSRIKNSPDKKTKKISQKIFESYCDRDGYLRSRITNSKITIKKNNIHILFKDCQVEKITECANLELTNGFFSLPTDYIKLSDGNSYVMVPQ